MEATSFQAIQKIADHIQKLVKLKPSVGIIAGTGLGVLATVVEPKHTIAYKHIPGFPQTTVAGHDGNLVFGMIAEKAVVIMQGRFHHYEGFSAEQIVLPIRVLKLLGVETLLISNAAGGLSKNLEVGDFVILTDHISLAGLTTDNVLVGPNDEHFGPRFPDIADAYCPQLRRLMQAVAGDLGLGDRVHTGVYFHTIGPSYGTKAENRMLIQLGGNVVGMSTVPEVVVARHCGMRVFAISVVTSMCNPDLQISEPTTHEDVLDAAKSSAKDLMRLFLELIRRM